MNDKMKWEKLKDDTIEHLRNLIRFDTTNPPGNEAAAAAYIAKVLKASGITSTILEAAPGRANLVARLKGNGERAPLLLTSHLDVVPAPAERWTHGPFSGDLAGGFVWGRGAVDMKNMTAMELAIFLALKKEKVKLRRDVILAAVADEETGGHLGAKWLVENHPDLVRAEYALNEMGGFTLHIGSKRFYPIQVAEKGYCWFRIRVRGEPGHGSVPHPDNSVLKLARIVERLGQKRLPQHETAPVRAFLEGVAAELKGPLALGIKALLSPTLSPLVLNGLLRGKPIASSMAAVLHNTATPTGLRAGTKVNVIPEEASVEVDGRILPGLGQEGFLKEVRELIGPEGEIEVIDSAPPTEIKKWKTELWGILEETVRRNDPGAHPVPYLAPGFTDAKHYSTLGTICYGFTPMKLAPDLQFSKLFHGIDERVSVDSLGFGVKSLYEVVTAICQ